MLNRKEKNAQHEDLVQAEVVRSEIHLNTEKNIKSLSGRFWKTVAFLLFVILCILAFLYYTNHKKLIRLSDPVFQAEETKKEILHVVEQVEQHMILPKDELPNIATITDAEKISAGQPFYKDVQNGDLVLLYSKNAKAVIWSPSRGLIINVGPILPEQNTAPVVPQTTNEQ